VVGGQPGGFAYGSDPGAAAPGGAGVLQGLLRVGVDRLARRNEVRADELRGQFAQRPEL
jgi:hypothetical protein